MIPLNNMFGGPRVAFRFEKRAWSEAARRGLSTTLLCDCSAIAAGVGSGTHELFRVNGDSWLVTQVVYGNKLFIWCYQGKRLVQLVEVLIRVARNTGLSYIGFFTRHPAALRALRRFHPMANPTPVEGETEYLIEV